MESGPNELSRSQARTRAAIVESTVSVLARNRTATLPEIATAAGVGRTTLHRYFADRERLIQEAIADSIRVLADVLRDAAPDQGPPLEAMRRTITALTTIGDRIVFLFGDPSTARDLPPDQVDDDPIMSLIRRGQAEGDYAADLPTVWIEHTLFALLLQACADVDDALPRHVVASTVIRTFEHGISAQ